MKSTLRCLALIGTTLAAQWLLCALAASSSDWIRSALNVCLAAALAVATGLIFRALRTSRLDYAIMLLGLGLPWLGLLSLALVYGPGAWLVGAPALSFLCLMSFRALRAPGSRPRWTTAVVAVFVLVAGLISIPGASGPGWVRALAHAQDQAARNGCTERDVAVLQGILEESPVDLRSRLGPRSCGGELPEEEQPAPYIWEGYTFGEILTDLARHAMVH